MLFQIILSAERFAAYITNITGHSLVYLGMVAQVSVAVQDKMAGGTLVPGGVGLVVLQQEGYFVVLLTTLGTFKGCHTQMLFLVKKIQVFEKYYNFRLHLVLN